MGLVITSVGMLRYRPSTQREYNTFMVIISVTINMIVWILNPKYILLDNQLTVDLFCNAALLIDIHKMDEELIIPYNAGDLTTNKMGTLSGYGIVWYGGRVRK